MRDRDDITNSITFLRLAKATDIPGEQGINEALLIVIHSNKKYNRKTGEQGKQRTNEPNNPTALMAKTQHLDKVVTTAAKAADGEDNVLHADRHSAT
jgi:hypothetical protein